MGFFKKIFKGIGKVFKKIGRGIKKVVLKVGKFMNKIGIVGQIAMAFILPGIGNMLMNGVGGIASSMVANTFGGIGGAIVKGAGHVISAAHKFVTVGKNAFNTVTQGVTKFVGEFGKTALNKIPGINIESASKNFFGTGGAWETVQKDIVKNAGNILNPFKSSVNITEGMDIKDVVNSSGVSRDRIQEMNIGVDLDNIKVGDKINFDSNSFGNTIAGQGPLAPKNMKFNSGINGLGEVDPYITQSGGTFDPSVTQGLSGDPSLDAAFGTSATKSTEIKAAGDWLKTQNEMSTYYKDKNIFNLQSNQSLLTPPDTIPDPNKTFLQAAGDELKGRYNFSETPLAASALAAKDAQELQQSFDPAIDLDPYGYNAPMYVSTGAQDYDVTTASAPRNFSAYSNMGQYGSTSRIYDSILMAPVSTWSRDLSARYT